MDAIFIVLAAILALILGAVSAYYVIRAAVRDGMRQASSAQLANSKAQTSLLFALAREQGVDDETIKAIVKSV